MQPASLHRAGPTQRFCSYCGEPVSGHGDAYRCSSCGQPRNGGPQLLSLINVYAQDKMLLIKRGVSPYKDKWAPPGGYVEHGESIEAAAARELFEETGLSVSPRELMVHGVISISAINQIHICLLALLDEPRPLRPAAPEALDARWFSIEDYPRGEIWDPFFTVPPEAIFQTCLTKRLSFLQQSDDAIRVIATDVGLTHSWKPLSPVSEN